jgi:Cd2+/Zn2+-exporting ATPase
VRHSRRVLGVIKQNIFLALALKIVFMALAVANLATLWMAIVADMGASLMVIANALRLLAEKKPAAKIPRPVPVKTES